MKKKKNAQKTETSVSELSMTYYAIAIFYNYSHNLIGY